MDIRPPRAGHTHLFVTTLYEGETLKTANLAMTKTTTTTTITTMLLVRGCAANPLHPHQ